MNNEIETAVKSWVLENIPFVATNKFDSIHLDALLPGIYTKANSISLAKTTFLILEEVTKADLSVEPFLTIPLGYGTNKLAANCPQNMDELQNQWDDFEPPSLYMLSSESLIPPETWEEYKCPLPFNLFEEDSPTYSYYREFRTLEDIKNDWEFFRCVYTRRIARTES
jgi:hypothetical protein